MKRFMAFFCVFSLVFSLFVTTTFAYEVYYIDADTMAQGLGEGSTSILDESLYSVSPYTMAGVQTIYDNAGVPYIFYQLSGMSDTVAQNAINGNASSLANSIVRTTNALYNLVGRVNTLESNTNSIADVIKAQLGFSDGFSLASGPYSIWTNSDTDYVSFKGSLDDVIYNLTYRSTQASVAPSGVYTLSNKGAELVTTGVGFWSYYELLSLVGLASILRGDSNSVVSGQVLNYETLEGTDFTANNLLSMLSPLLTLQNDLARITHVIADPQDQAIKDANKDNYQAFEDLSKGDAALKPSDIGDMAGVSGDLTGMLDTGGVSIGDAFEQASGDGALAFFSQAAADDLDSTVQTFGLDDDFIHPDWSNWSLLEGVPLE